MPLEVDPSDLRSFFCCRSREARPVKDQENDNPSKNPMIICLVIIRDGQLIQDGGSSGNIELEAQFIVGSVRIAKNRNYAKFVTCQHNSAAILCRSSKRVYRSYYYGCTQSASRNLWLGAESDHWTLSSFFLVSGCLLVDYHSCAPHPNYGSPALLSDL